MAETLSHDRATDRDPMHRLAAALYVLFAVAELGHWAIVPLLPAYAERFGLSQVESGALVAATGLATLVVSLPAGVLAERLGARRLTLVATGTLAAAAAAQALAPTYALLLAARLLLGLGFGIVWTAGLAWLTAATADRSAAGALGGTVTSAGIGVVVAPGFAGVVAEVLGLAAPPLVVATVALVLLVVLARCAAV
ncbi:MAG: MFS transporter, partial [Actinomycetota bacterium]|nr:MFS transporter [Actinomycetota bacterium]